MACWARFLVSGTQCLSWHRDMRIAWSGHASIPPSTKSNLTWYRDIAVLLNIPVRCKKHKFLNEWTPAPSKAVALANLRSSKRPYFLYSYSLLCLIYKKWVIFQIPLVLSSREALKYSLFRRKLELLHEQGTGSVATKGPHSRDRILQIISTWAWRNLVAVSATPLFMFPSGDTVN